MVDNKPTITIAVEFNLTKLVPRRHLQSRPLRARAPNLPFFHALRARAIGKTVRQRNRKKSQFSFSLYQDQQPRRRTAKDVSATSISDQIPGPRRPRPSRLTWSWTWATAAPPAVLLEAPERRQRGQLLQLPPPSPDHRASRQRNRPRQTLGRSLQAPALGEQTMIDSWFCCTTPPSPTWNRPAQLRRTGA